MAAFQYRPCSTGDERRLTWLCCSPRGFWRRRCPPCTALWRPPCLRAAHGVRTEEQRGAGTANDVRAAAAHVAKASAARTLAGAPMGWTSARGSTLCLKLIPLRAIKRKRPCFTWLMHRMYDYKESWDRPTSMRRKINISNDVLTSCAHVVHLALTWRFLFSHGRRVQATRFRVGEKDIWVRHQMF